MKSCVLEGHTRNMIGIIIIGYVISGRAMNKKTNTMAWVVSFVIHIDTFRKPRKSGNVKHRTGNISAQNIAVCVSNGSHIFSYRKVFDLVNLIFGLHSMIGICLIQILHRWCNQIFPSRKQCYQLDIMLPLHIHPGGWICDLLKIKICSS